MATAQYENVIIVSRKTELDDLVARFNTKAQAKFYLQQAGQSFETIEAAHEKHQQVLSKVRQTMPTAVKSQLIDREMVPRFTFGKADLVVTVGQDGLVSNTAKYLTGQPILAVNPDPERFDGILLPFTEETLEQQLGISPSPETVTLYEQIRGGSFDRKERTITETFATGNQSMPMHNLPVSPTPFIGRKSELAEIAERLADPA